MLVMGGIVGSGIFMNPYVVARQVHTPFLILGAWAGGRRSSRCRARSSTPSSRTRRPHAGGQYAYLREAYHPAVAFVYGWVLLLVTQTRRDGGGRRHVRPLLPRDLPACAVATGVVAARRRCSALTAINCFGVARRQQRAERSHGAQDRAIAALVALGLCARRRPPARRCPLLDRPVSLDLLAAIGAAHGAGAVRLRRMADGQLRGGRDARPARATSARAAARRDRRGRALPGGELRLRASARARRPCRHRARRRRT